MPALLVPMRRTAQPQYACGVDWSNPITSGSKSVLNPAVGIVNLADSNKPFTITAGPTVSVGPYGRQLDFNGSTQFLQTTGLAHSAQFAWFGRVKLGSTSSGTLFGIASKHTTDGSASDWTIYRNATGNLLVDIPWVANIITTSGTYTAGTWLDIGVIRTGSTGAWNWYLYINGTLVNSALSNANNPNTSSHPYNFSALSSTTNITSNSYAYAALIHGQVPLAYAPEMARNPWQLFSPRLV